LLLGTSGLAMDPELEVGFDKTGGAEKIQENRLRR